MIDGILKQAVDQAMNGKGKRHGGNSVPWLEQPWKVYTDMFSEGFLKGQAVKKMEEAVSTRTGESFKHEMLGAIVYMMASVSHRKGISLDDSCKRMLGRNTTTRTEHLARIYGHKGLILQATICLHENEDIDDAIYLAARAIMEAENETNRSR